MLQWDERVGNRKAMKFVYRGEGDLAVGKTDSDITTTTVF